MAPNQKINRNHNQEAFYLTPSEYIDEPLGDGWGQRVREEGVGGTFGLNGIIQGFSLLQSTNKLHSLAQIRTERLDHKKPLISSCGVVWTGEAGTCLRVLRDAQSC